MIPNFIHVWCQIRPAPNLTHYHPYYMLTTLLQPISGKAWRLCWLAGGVEEDGADGAASQGKCVPIHLPSDYM
jgi:hypothetical protein